MPMETMIAHSTNKFLQWIYKISFPKLKIKLKDSTIKLNQNNFLKIWKIKKNMGSNCKEI